MSQYTVFEGAAVDIDTLIAAIGFVSIVLQLAMAWPYQRTDHFKKHSYYKSILSIRHARPVYGLVLVILFYTALVAVASLLIRSI